MLSILLLGWRRSGFGQGRLATERGRVRWHVGLWQGEKSHLVDSLRDRNATRCKIIFGNCQELYHTSICRTGELVLHKVLKAASTVFIHCRSSETRNCGDGEEVGWLTAGSE